MKKKNQMSHTNRYILLGLSIFCVLMMVLSSFSDKVGGPFKTVANVTVIPLQQGMNQIGGWMGDMKDNFSTMKQLKSENKKLREQVDALTTENNYLQEERYEFERLQELYKLDQNYAEYEKTAAHVIGKDAGNWFGTFTIDKGSKDGIEVNMNVLAGSGLVGIVTDVGPTWAKVREEKNSIEEVENVVAETESLLSDLVESADEESALADVAENGKVKAKDLEAKIEELTQHVETEETIELELLMDQLPMQKKRLQAYLVGHPLCESAVTEKGTVTKSSIMLRLFIIRTVESVPESLQDDVNQLKQALDLCGKVSDYNKIVKCIC